MVKFCLCGWPELVPDGGMQTGNFFSGAIFLVPVGMGWGGAGQLSARSLPRSKGSQARWKARAVSASERARTSSITLRLLPAAALPPVSGE